MKPAAFRLHNPQSVAEAISLLAEYAPEDGRVLAGGQSLVPSMAFRMARPAHLIDINGIHELSSINSEGDVLTIGACVRHATLETEDIPGPTGRLLRSVARHIAHYPIRTRGTFGGSLANADPASEWCCATVALDGELLLRSQAGQRRAPAIEFFQGIMTTSINDDELLVGCELPVLPLDARTAFIEFSPRKGDFAIAMALVVYRVVDGKMAEPRLAIGGVEAHARRISEAEAVLDGAAPEKAIFAKAAQIAAVVCDPLEDVNNTAEYRRSLVRTLAERALEAAA